MRPRPCTPTVHGRGWWGCLIRTTGCRHRRHPSHPPMAAPRPPSPPPCWRPTALACTWDGSGWATNGYGAGGLNAAPSVMAAASAMPAAAVAVLATVAAGRCDPVPWRRDATTAAAGCLPSPPLGRVGRRRSGAAARVRARRGRRPPQSSAAAVPLPRGSRHTGRARTWRAATIHRHGGRASPRWIGRGCGLGQAVREGHGSQMGVG